LHPSFDRSRDGSPACGITLPGEAPGHPVNPRQPPCSPWFYTGGRLLRILRGPEGNYMPHLYKFCSGDNTGEDTMRGAEITGTLVSASSRQEQRCRVKTEGIPDMPLFTGAPAVMPERMSPGCAQPAVFRAHHRPIFRSISSSVG
jgi:hypothetical protein